MKAKAEEYFKKICLEKGINGVNEHSSFRWDEVIEFMVGFLESSTHINTSKEEEFIISNEQQPHCSGLYFTVNVQNQEQWTLFKDRHWQIDLEKGQSPVLKWRKKSSPEQKNNYINSEEMKKVYEDAYNEGFEDRDLGMDRRAEQASNDWLLSKLKQEHSNWISVEDRLPDLELHEGTTSKYVIIHYLYEGDEYVGRGNLYNHYSAENNVWLDSDGEVVKVINWQPLPSPPKQD